MVDLDSISKFVLNYLFYFCRQLSLVVYLMLGNLKAGETLSARNDDFSKTSFLYFSQIL